MKHHLYSIARMFQVTPSHTHAWYKFNMQADIPDMSMHPYSRADGERERERDREKME